MQNHHLPFPQKKSGKSRYKKLPLSYIHICTLYNTYRCEKKTCITLPPLQIHPTCPTPELAINFNSTKMHYIKKNKSVMLFFVEYKKDLFKLFKNAPKEFSIRTTKMLLPQRKQLSIQHSLVNNNYLGERIFFSSNVSK